MQGVRLNVNVIADENLVKAPGNYQLDGRSSFVRAISAAGGLVGSPDRVMATVRRGNVAIPVDVRRALYDPAADIDLKNNDIILLAPVEGPRVRLAGEVKTPGQYNFKEGTKVLDAILEAGGLLNLTPQNARIAVLRNLPDDRQIAFQVDAGRLYGGNDLSQNAKLQDKDTIIVNPIGVRSVAVVGEVEKRALTNSSRATA